MVRIPEISYIAIGFVARFPAAIPILAALCALVLPLCFFWTSLTIVFSIVILFGAAALWLVVRLVVEIVVVMADTLLPR